MNSPLPQDLTAECKKAAKIINSFVNPENKNSLDSVIPPWVITNAKGVAILTVIKAGFLFSGRAGSGLVVARLDDGSWSAPSAIFTSGMGVGGQIGAELTDFVIILNTKDAVKAFSYGGNVTLGGNLSVAAGPIGRNAEAAGTIGNFAAIYSYSKTRGLFAGVSIEGTVILERKEANANFYHRKVSARDILDGRVPPPPSSEDLYRALNRRVESGAIYSNVNEEYESPASRFSRFTTKGNSNDNDRRDRDRERDRDSDRDSDRHYDSRRNYDYDNEKDRFSTSTQRTKAPPPPQRKDDRVTAVALFDFEAQRDGDLAFRKGDIIIIVEKSDSQDDWWTGRCAGKVGQVIPLISITPRCETYWGF
ncbi:hypothetical protein HK096_003639 [Nowakowskiella sp. JEL0078]|nr:hypothetical protein HK096_003639 [Nowakowskiella sp. JEL0078]